MNCIIKTSIILLVFNAVTSCYTGTVTFVEADDPVSLTAEQELLWDMAEDGLNAAWGSTDFSYGRSVVPSGLSDEPFRLTVWKGERAYAQLVLWTSEAMSRVKCKMGTFRSENATISSSAAMAYFVRYTIGEEITSEFLETRRFKKGQYPTQLAPDMLDTLSCLDMEARTVRPVWVCINVPSDAQAGVYKADVTITHKGFEKTVLPLELEVVNHVLPSPDKWNYHLDLWQHPAAVARAHGLELWSDAHFEVLKPVMKRLADAGQKVVTATLNKDPWNHQCYDAYEPMIKWTKNADGTWTYDYTVFDRWVQLMLDLGIKREINCYSMVPWNCELEYFDKTEDKKVTVKAEPGTELFTEMWTPFLLDFKGHLEEKGWLSITNIAMDERSPEAMQAAADLLMACAPEMGFALADNHSSYKKFAMMRDVCVALFNNGVSSEDIESRRSQNFYTTFYVCCYPSYPNTFTTSAPYESELFGWYNLAHDYDGMLRWAYNSWPENPEYDSRFGKWMSGDTYFVYPYNRSSVRFEKLIDGIEVAEKVRQLRREGVDTAPVEAVLEKMRNTDITDWKQPWQQILVEAREALDEVSRRN